MKVIVAIITLLLVSCYIEPPHPSPPAPYPYPYPYPDPESDSWCGDGYCDEWRGEDAWWCSDCGFDPLTGGPRDGGLCGDGVCFGGEDEFTCYKDCRPEPFRPNDPRNPGWIDPPRR